MGFNTGLLPLYYPVVVGHKGEAAQTGCISCASSNSYLLLQRHLFLLPILLATDIGVPPLLGGFAP
eukprot:16086485-Heterocapsa_arctica.AAC.1